MAKAKRAAQTSSFCVVPLPECKWPHIILSRGVTMLNSKIHCLWLTYCNRDDQKKGN